MTQTKRLLYAVITAACFWPLVAAAQEQPPDAAALLEKGLKARPELGYTSEVEAGAGYVTEDSFKFGEYSGLEDQGPFGIGNVTVRGRAAFDSESSQYWEATGTNLGLDSRSIHLEYGHQGDFDLFLDYDQTPRNQIDDARTPFIGAGGGNLTLPPGFTRGNSPSNMPDLFSSLREVEIETERKELGGGITWHLSKEWTIKGTYEHEFKDGTDTIAGIFAENGGDPAAAILPEPIDYEEDRTNLALSYSGKRLQAELAYQGSWFTNNEDSLRWDNPFNAPPSGSWGITPDEGQMGLPPDNQAHRVSLSAGYNLGETTRLNGVFSYGRMLQDENFLPFTITSSLNTPLPRQSLDGDIENILVNLSARTRPMAGLNLGARYRYDDRNNNTPQDVYELIRSDTQDAGDERINLPYSSTQHLVNLDAGYRILPRTKLSIGYDFKQTERTFTEVEKTRDHTGRAKIQSTPLNYLSGSLAYAHTIRDGSGYQGNAPLLASHVGLPADDFENHPDLRKFYLADRDSDTISASLTVLPHPQVSVGLGGNYTIHDYDDGLYGLRDHAIANVTLDISYSPMTNLTATAFFTHERQTFEQQGIQFSGSGSGHANALLNDPADQWSVDAHDRVNSVGARVEWNAIKDLLDVNLEYIFSRAVTDFDIAGGSNRTFEPLPDLVSQIHSLGINGRYHLDDQTAINFGYRFQTLSTDDFALDGVGVDTIDQVLSLGESSPNYVAHVFGVSLSYRF